VWSVIDELTEDLPGRPILVMKSTVPVGTGDNVRARLDARGLTNVGYVSNPEFLAEGSAIEDFMSPDRIVVGAFEPEDAERVVDLHTGIDTEVVRTDVSSAELVKLAANAFLSTRISFINEIANVCDLVGADVVDVAKGVGLDHLLGPHFLRAGLGFGGSCFVGSETVLVRMRGKTRLLTLAALYDKVEPGEPLEILSWRRDRDGAEFLPVDVLTQRPYNGEVLEVRTKMGRRVTVTPDHPFVTRAGLKLAEHLTNEDWLPIAQGIDVRARSRPRILDVIGAYDGVEDVIVRPRASELVAVERGSIPAERFGAIWRSGEPAMHEAVEPDVEMEDRYVGAPRTSTSAPATLVEDAAFWRVVGLYVADGDMTTQRVPDLLWDEPDEHKRAFLAGAWLRDGSWSYISGGPSVALELGTASRELADGLLRLLGDLGIVARLKVGRTAKSTVDYWLVVSGAHQVEQLLDLVDRRDDLAKTLTKTKRIAPTAYERGENAAWVRVVSVTRKHYDGPVFSMEVEPSHTLVTSGGLIASNCFPKDVTSLKQLAGNSGYQFMLLHAVWEVNELQKRRVVQKLQKHLGSLRGKTVALLGLAFKPNTDDMREAPSSVIAYRLLSEGAEVRAWDPVARPDDLHGIELSDSILDAVRDADAAVIVTEWPELKAVATPEVRDAMARPVIVDGRNLLDPVATRAAGFIYEGIGRPRHASPPEPQAAPDPELSL